MTQRYLSLSLIVVAGVLTYLCATMAGLLSIDDVGMVNSLASDSYTLRSLFLSGANEYYRPLVVISYTFNATLFGLDPFWFHAVNVALHIANALLVYWLALSLFRLREEREGIALLASLCFLLTPLNSEAVVWISARPDLLCTFFFLLAVTLLVQRRDSATAGTLCCFTVAYLCSLASKETSIALVGIAPLFLLATARRDNRRAGVMFMSALLLATAMYAWLRTGGKLALDKGLRTVAHGVGNALQGTESAVQQTGAAAQGAAQALAAGGGAAGHPSLIDGLGALGFYLGKLVWPFPLNFTILDYDRSLALLSLALAVPVAVWLLMRYKQALLPLLIVFLGVTPALLAYLGRIAFTPLGERYLYLPMVGFALLVGLLLALPRRMPRLVPVAALLLIAIPTMSRVSLWCRPTEFWNDALRKGPGFAKSYSALGAIAIKEQRYLDAERHIKTAMALGYNDALIWQNLARVYAEQKEYARYETAMVKAAEKSRYPTGIYQELILALMDTPQERSGRYARSIKYHLLALSKDPSYLEAYYHVAKLYLATGDKDNARRYLTLYLEKVAKGANRPFAQKMLDKLTGRAHHAVVAPSPAGGFPAAAEVAP